MATSIEPVSAGTFELTVIHSETSHMPPSTYVASDAFAVGSLYWCLRYYPNGLASGGPDDGPCFCLVLLSYAGEGVRAVVDFALTLARGFPMMVRRTVPCVFFRSGRGPRFPGHPGIERDGFEGCYVRDDRFVAICTLAVMRPHEYCPRSILFFPPVQLGPMRTSMDPAAAGSMELTVIHSRTKNMPKFSYVTSNPFTIEGLQWAIRYYPKRFPSHRSPCAPSFHLELCSQTDETVTAMVSFTQIPAAKDTPWADGRSMHCTFSCPGLCNTSYKFSEFPRLRPRRDDLFVIVCTVTMIRPHQQSRPAPVVAALPASNSLHSCLGDILTTGDMADVTFHVGGETFAAHKVVLASRSPVLRKALFGEMKESHASRVEIADMDPAVFGALLRFIYTDLLPPEEDSGDSGSMAMMQHLLAAADRYMVERLKLMCEDRLCREMKADFVATTLVLAEQYGCRRLKEFCLQFAAADGPESLVEMRRASPEGFRHLVQSCPSVVEELRFRTAAPPLDLDDMKAKVKRMRTGEKENRRSDLVLFTPLSELIL